MQNKSIRCCRVLCNRQEHKSQTKKDCQPWRNSRDVMVGLIFNVYDEQGLVSFQCLIGALMAVFLEGSKWRIKLYKAWKGGGSAYEDTIGKAILRHQACIVRKGQWGWTGSTVLIANECHRCHAHRYFRISGFFVPDSPFLNISGMGCKFWQIISTWPLWRDFCSRTESQFLSAI